MVSEQTILFSPIELKLFLGFSDPWTTKWPITYMSVIVWFCDRFVCVTLVVSSFLYLNMFQSALNLVQIFLNAMPWDCLFFFYFSFLRFSLTLSIFWDLANFFRWNPDRFQIEFLWFLWGKWTILRLFYKGVCCTKICIFEIFYLLMIL